MTNHARINQERELPARIPFQSWQQHQNNLSFLSVPIDMAHSQKNSDTRGNGRQPLNRGETSHIAHLPAPTDHR